MMTKRRLSRRGAVVAGIVLTGGLVAGGATAYAAGSSGTPAPAASASAKAHKYPGKRKPRPLFAVGVHGQVTVRNAKTGRFVVREWQRGQVTGVSGDHVTVRSADGVSWTWTVEKNAKITRDGKKITDSALKNGDTVLVVGRQAGGANDAGRVFAPSPAQIAKMKAKAAQHRSNA